jgi:hypothetical protein
MRSVWSLAVHVVVRGLLFCRLERWDKVERNLEQVRALSPSRDSGFTAR